MKYGTQGFWCWCAFSVLLIGVSGGFLRAAACLALLVGATVEGQEPFAVLLVSIFAAQLAYSYLFPAKVDDTQVSQRPYEQEIRRILFVHDPSHLHLVDAELDRYRGREKQLLQEYRRTYQAGEKRSNGVKDDDPPREVIRNPSVERDREDIEDEMGFDDRGGGNEGEDRGAEPEGFVKTDDHPQDTGGTPESTLRMRKNALQLAHEEERRRVQENIRQSVQRLTDRANRRR